MLCEKRLNFAELGMKYNSWFCCVFHKLFAFTIWSSDVTISAYFLFLLIYIWNWSLSGIVLALRSRLALDKWYDWVLLILSSQPLITPSNFISNSHIATKSCLCVKLFRFDISNFEQSHKTNIFFQTPLFVVYVYGVETFQQ